MKVNHVRKKAPCFRRNIYTDPYKYPVSAQEGAARMCQKLCPYIKECARKALTDGGTLDGHSILPAQGVIVAGVLCPPKGVKHAAQLAAIAGVAVPIYRNEKPRPDVKKCAVCNRPMVSWSRSKETVPAGYVMHHARGICTTARCRATYRGELKKPERRKGFAGYSVGERPDHKNYVAWVLRNRPPGTPRPRRCVDCNRRLSQQAEQGAITHRGRGLCSTCYKHWKDYIYTYGQAHALAG